MAVVLYVLGGLAVMAGAALAGFGIPIKEFGIGNTLILSGAVVFTGGLIVFGLAAVVAHLVRLTDMVASRGPVRDARSLEPFERAAAPAGAGEGRIPFPQRPKPPANVPPVADARPPIPPPPAMPMDEPHAPVPAPGLPPGQSIPSPSSSSQPSPSLAPSLRNPDLADDGDDIPPPKPPAMKPASERAEPPAEPNLPPPPPLPSAFSKPAAPQMPPPPPPPRPAPAVRPPQPNYFDTVWPAEDKPEKKSSVEDAPARPVPRFEAPAPDLPPPPPPVMPAPAAPPPPAVEPEKPAGGEEMRAAAVLKSGVVDGMAYTLYVDGSIEAELPDGTLRFASINALREHLEKGGSA